MDNNLDETRTFTPQFNADGLIPAVATDAKSGELLMLAWMNQTSIDKTLETGYAHYWSRSRQKLWQKGETSGHTQKIVEIRIDCDQDTIQLIVDQTGAACHTGRPTCFYRTVTADGKSLTN
ncbi:MAG: phosphoribosyl-AMP cyclohydrolase [Pseudomonadota bacterium]